jgi:Cytochrome bd terminal oxidase subunit II
MAYFTDFTPRGDVGLLDWYTVSVALFAAVALPAHAAAYLTRKTQGVVHERSAGYARILWTAAAALLLVISVASAVVRPAVLGHAMQNPYWWLGLLRVCAAAITLISGLPTRREVLAFIGSRSEARPPRRLSIVRQQPRVFHHMRRAPWKIIPYSLHSAWQADDSIKKPRRNLLLQRGL